MKKVLLGLLSCCFFATVHAQVIYNSSGRKGEAHYKKNAQKKGFDTHRLIFGGGFGFGLGSGSLALAASPVVGYRISNRFSAGVRLSYQYNWVKNGQVFMNGVSGLTNAKGINYHIIAPGVWARFLVWNNLFLHVLYEYDIFTYRQFETAPNPPGYTSTQRWDYAHCLLPGIGYRQPVSQNASFVILMSYDVLQNIPANLRTDYYGQEYSISPYAGRLDFRIGFNVGF